MTEPQQSRMRPIIILPPGAVSQKDMQRLRDNLCCVIVAKDPSLVRFSEPPPEGYTAQERACIRLCRVLLSKTNRENNITGTNLAGLYVDMLLEGTPLEIRAPESVLPVKK